MHISLRSEGEHTRGDCRAAPNGVADADLRSHAVASRSGDHIYPRAHSDTRADTGAHAGDDS